MFLIVSLFFVGFHPAPLDHILISIRCSYCSLGFLGPHLAVAVAAVIAVVALLVGPFLLAVAIAVVDLRHDALENN